ncbi:phosphoethanolamine N-methyltransferase [Artemisia annua]|uniref:phosphoethanolamine N-methyltransferase n=1 Tax=Artemisia annua TaxID=35608 RepID=A0A2U1MJG1_ARTAN|nr:phosphoethanolamine N-methyltransferase [Artemisia annua]
MSGAHYCLRLDSMATELNNEERLKLLSFLPPYEGKSVLELGAGQGHFTRELAKKAGKVIALDSVESVVEENGNINGNYENVEFMCADVTSPDLNFPAETVDLIFTRALLSNLSDKEVKDIAEKLLKWVKVGGYIFFTEPCSHQSEDHKQKSDLEHIREPRFYIKFFHTFHLITENHSYQFKPYTQCNDMGLRVFADKKISEVFADQKIWGSLDRSEKLIRIWNQVLALSTKLEVSTVWFMCQQYGTTWFQFNPRFYFWSQHLQIINDNGSNVMFSKQKPHSLYLFQYLTILKALYLIEYQVMNLKVQRSI